MSAPPRSHPSRWTTSVQRYGWRAYALPVLTIITIVALVRGIPGPAAAGHPAAAGRPAAAKAAGTAHTVTLPAARDVSGSGGSTNGGAEGSPAPGVGAGATPPPVVVPLKSDTAAVCASNRDQKLLIVSLAQQHLWACELQVQVNSTPVTTGATLDNDQTPVGSWRVQAKQRDRYLVGPGYNDYVQYWVPFNGDFGFHDASWQTIPFGSPQYHQLGSHGCVHVPTPMMAWLYLWAAADSTVVTIEA